MRTLTVRCLAAPGTYAADILKGTLPKVKALELPPGYHLELGGEFANQEETQPEMVAALSISLLAIFLILMLIHLYEELFLAKEPMTQQIPLIIATVIVALALALERIFVSRLHITFFERLREKDAPKNNP